MSVGRPQVRCAPVVGEELARERAASNARRAAMSEAAIERLRESARTPCARNFICGKNARGQSVWYPKPGHIQQSGAE